MTANRKKLLIIFSIVFIAIYGIGVQPYFDLYLLIFTPESLEGLLVFKWLVIYKFLLAFAILITSIETFKRRAITIPFLSFNIAYSLSVVFLNTLVLLGYNELNSFYYTDGFLEVRIIQQVIWIAIISMIFKRKTLNET